MYMYVFIHYSHFTDCQELEQDEDLIDDAINSEAFQFFRHSVLASPNFFQEVH